MIKESVEMIKKNGFKRLLKSRTGGIGTIIAMVVSIILVLGLIAYTVLGQVAGAKDTGDRAQIEQDKINQMLQDPNIVTGNVVKNYFNQKEEGHYDVTILPPTGTTSMDIVRVVDGALFKEDKEYNADGKLSLVTFTQVSLSR
jgi:hypothetical protein